MRSGQLVRERVAAMKGGKRSTWRPSPLMILEEFIDGYTKVISSKIAWTSTSGPKL